MYYFLLIFFMKTVVNSLDVLFYILYRIFTMEAAVKHKFYLFSCKI